MTITRPVVPWSAVRDWYQEVSDSAELATPYGALPAALEGLLLQINGSRAATISGYWERDADQLFLAGEHDPDEISIADRALILLALLEVYPPTTANDAEVAEISAVRVNLIKRLADIAVHKPSYIETADGDYTLDGIGLAGNTVVAFSDGKWFSADGREMAPDTYAKWA